MIQGSLRFGSRSLATVRLDREVDQFCRFIVREVQSAFHEEVSRVSRRAGPSTHSQTCSNLVL